MRCCKLLDDGHHGVSSGERGIWAGNRPGAPFSAEAITDSVIVKRSAILSLAAHDGEIARQLWTLTA